jgi:hypothetical protein
MAAHTPKRVISLIESIFKRTATTTIFNGIRNRFIIVDLVDSGIKTDLRLPMDGKYIPQHNSNILNAK